MPKRPDAFAGLLAVLTLAATPRPAPEPPGGSFQPPARPTTPGAPLVYEHTGEAGPDETFFLVGESLSTNIVGWGISADNPGGREWKPRAQFLTNGYLAASVPERAQDGPFLVWIQNQAGWSAPVVLNAPQVWWCGPDVAAPGGEVRLFGRNLSRRPDFVRAFVWLAKPGQVGQWAEIRKTGKHAATFRVPEQASPGDYEVWVHAGAGGEWGWGGPVMLRVEAADRRASSRTTGQRSGPLRPANGSELQQALDALAAQGGGRLALAPGQFTFGATLRIPAGVVLQGAGKDLTTLQLVHDPSARFARLSGSGWNQAPGAVHTPGDTIEYQVEMPRAGEWTVWVRYATDMAPWKQPGVSGNHTLAADNGPPVSLMNLTNTGSFGAFQWGRSATMKLAAGRHKLTWRNVKGGGSLAGCLPVRLGSGL